MYQFQLIVGTSLWYVLHFLGHKIIFNGYTSFKQNE